MCYSDDKTIENYSTDDLTKKSKQDCIDDCKAFLSVAAPYLVVAANEHGYSMGQAGCDFWLTRNHNGAGFWDRGLGAIGNVLTDMAQSKAFGESYVYSCGNGKVGIE
jgi:hypothetical protein